MKAGVNALASPVFFEYVPHDEHAERVGLVADPADVIADLMQAVQDQADRIAKLEARLDASQ